MVVRIVRLGTPRAADEGTRIGTVRRPPRGVPKSQFASGNWYDVWYPDLAPSPDTVTFAQHADSAAQWTEFVRRYRKETAAPERQRTIQLLAALSHAANFSVGCYCADALHCHRSALGALLRENGARLE